MNIDLEGQLPSLAPNELIPQPPRVGDSHRRSLKNRHRVDRFFVRFCMLTAFASIVILAVLLGSILYAGLPGMNWHFIRSAPSSVPSEAGIQPAMFGSIWVCSVCALFALPIGVATAIFLEEFPARSKFAKMFQSFVQLNISNLASVPSVVYGMIGLTVFAGMFGLLGSSRAPAVEVGVNYFHQFLSEGDRILRVPVKNQQASATVVASPMTALTSSGTLVQVNVIGARDPLPKSPELRAVTLRSDAESGIISDKAWYYFRFPFGRGVLTGGLTLMLVILPVVIIASQEALRGVPESLREASFGIGATRWQTVQNVTLPCAIPGIMTGSILAMSRAIGEAAPILIICGIIYVGASPANLMDDFSVMPLQIFNWASQPQQEFHAVAAQGIIVLLVILLSFNAIAVFIRQTAQKSLS
ncbi:PstA family ABC transporter permease [Allorhodopirellula heiligendammensis]|uniref:Phosphate transport system permease protein PstA n=1 Tax=Allorhodopirellula heiligendammensis TaxID=2714739 RepID=A0A5C6C263_9BACT|nr:PstA family ABC transporter permease [Allorhodopirellula heiligendammensis]TWU18218.1 Phosphate transport system permease protein PstA [Allorhodopirellula heiligendammensis]